MKNGFVLVHHYGDDGEAKEGMILREMTEDRFRKLGPDGSGLVREATAAEVEAGYLPTIEADPTKDQAGDDAADAAESGEKQAEKPANKAAPKPANKAA